MDRLPDPIVELLTTYNELNSPVVEVLQEEPSPLEFMRFVAQNTPFVVRSGASGWRASKLWSAAYLKDFLKTQTVNVAVTPKGSVQVSLCLVFAHMCSSEHIPFAIVMSHRD